MHLTWIKRDKDYVTDKFGIIRYSQNNFAQSMVLQSISNYTNIAKVISFLDHNGRANLSRDGNTPQVQDNLKKKNKGRRITIGLANDNNHEKKKEEDDEAVLKSYPCANCGFRELDQNPIAKETMANMLDASMIIIDRYRPGIYLNQHWNNKFCFVVRQKMGGYHTDVVCGDLLPDARPPSDFRLTSISLSHESVTSDKHGGEGILLLF